VAHRLCELVNGRHRGRRFRGLAGPIEDHLPALATEQCDDDGHLVAHVLLERLSATAMVIIGPAGNDMQMLPPTVAEFHTLNDARKAPQLALSSDPASQSAGGSNS
jgi:hypothetical protein